MIFLLPRQHNSIVLTQSLYYIASDFQQLTVFKLKHAHFLALPELITFSMLQQKLSAFHPMVAWNALIYLKLFFLDPLMEWIQLDRVHYKDE